jgi:methionyl-tRNA formyltransferase
VIVRVIGNDADPIVRQARALVAEMGFVETFGSNSADVAVAPLLRSKLSDAETHAPRYGTLIFHPSLLPRHRGPDAIKAAFRARESYTGATWFWANARYDAGDVCEQEVLEILSGESPRAFYERAVIPSALRLLRYALEDLRAGHARRRPQREEAATYERKAEAPVNPYTLIDLEK